MTESTEPSRDVQSVSVDGQMTTFVSPSEQVVEDARRARQRGLKRNKPLAGFLRIFKMNLQDRPG